MDGSLLGPPRFTAVPTPAARAFLIDRRYRSREGGIRASVRGAPLPRPGQKSSYSFLSTKNWRTRDAVDDDVRKSLGKPSGTRKGEQQTTRRASLRCQKGGF